MGHAPQMNRVKLNRVTAFSATVSSPLTKVVALLGEAGNKKAEHSAKRRTL